MKKMAPSLSQTKNQAGFSLIELAVVLMIIVILASIAAFSIPAWRNASARSVCINNQASVQKAMRSWVAMFNPAATSVNMVNIAGNSTTSLMPFPVCPAGGIYSPAANATGISVPATGVRFLGCTAADHNATAISGW